MSETSLYIEKGVRGGFQPCVGGRQTHHGRLHWLLLQLLVLLWVALRSFRCKFRSNYRLLALAQGHWCVVQLVENGVREGGWLVLVGTTSSYVAGYVGGGYQQQSCSMWVASWGRCCQNWGAESDCSSGVLGSALAHRVARRVALARVLV